MLPIYIHHQKSISLPYLSKNEQLETLLRDMFSICESSIVNTGTELNSLHDSLYLMSYMITDKQSDKKRRSDKIHLSKYEIIEHLESLKKSKLKSLDSEAIILPLSLNERYLTALWNQQANKWTLTIENISALRRFLIASIEFYAEKNETIFHISDKNTKKEDLSKIVDFIRINNRFFVSSNITRLEGKIVDLDVAISCVYISSNGEQNNKSFKQSNQNELVPQKIPDSDTAPLQKTSSAKFTGEVVFEISKIPETNIENVCILDTHNFIKSINKNSYKNIFEYIQYLLTPQNGHQYTSFIFNSLYESANHPDSKSVSASHGAHTILKDSKFFIQEMAMLKKLRDDKKVKITYYTIPFLREVTHLESIMAIARKEGFTRSPQSRFAVKLDTFASIMQLESITKLKIDAIILNPTQILRSTYAFDSNLINPLFESESAHLDKIMQHIHQVTKNQNIKLFCEIKTENELNFFETHLNHKWIPILEP